MKFLKFLSCVLTLTALLALCGCDAAKPEGAAADFRVISLMTWNVHNLFDGKDDGCEYAEFQQASGWSAEKYKGRLNNISAAVNSIDPLPDIIVFQEIESFDVLKDLAVALSDTYSWSHFANNPESGIGLGLISRFEILEGKSHSISIKGEVTPRPVLEARILAGEEEIIIFACHWKSKIGGDEATENVRMASARVILRRIRDIFKNEPEIGVIIAGDLNENYDEFFRRGSSPICALLPDDIKSSQIVMQMPAYFTAQPPAPEAGETNAAELFTQKDFIVINGNMPPLPVHFPKETIVLFSPWMSELEFGSYYYKGNWETIDHFLISHHFFNNTGLEYESAFVADFEPFANHDGIPVSYSQRTGNGLSDHLPLMIYLKY